MKYSAGAFTNITNADGMEGFINWSNANNIYAGIQYGGFYRSTDGGATFTNISTPGGGAWVAPWCQHPTAPNTLYAGTNKVYKSTNQGTTWTAISGSLAGIGVFTVLKVAQSNPDVIYAGSGSRLYRTANGGVAWTDISSGLPTAANYLTEVAIHASDPNKAYATFSGYNAGEKVYKTSNGGGSWTNLSGALPNMPANTIVCQKSLLNGLYVGTDAGVYYRNDLLGDWIPYKWGLPNVIVDELEIHYGAKVIRAATYGRGMWQAPLK
jgi:xyloglucan-specific exo-beta-1,4-glucanase